MTGEVESAALKDFSQQEEYPRLLARAKPNDKCLPCALCEPVCPTGAIKVVFAPTRDDLGPLRKGIAGSITVDREKCNLCGKCARFCKAFLLLDKETKDPRDLIPYDQLLVDEELCDYCGLCAPLCPEEAITVEGEPLDVKLDFKGTIDVDQSLCIGCGKCYLVCPYEAMDVTKPFQGEIRLVEGNLVKCDPLGCHGCFNVCPAQCWYVDERGKAAMVKDQCILCGACAMACHCRAIEVERSKVSHTPIKETPWASEWKDAISSILTKRKRRPDVSMAVSPPAYERPKPGCVEIPLRDPELLKLVEERLADLEPLLEKTKVRFILEREPPEEAAKKILARMKKSEKSGTGGEDGG